ncbi:MAG: hypothetical protein ACLQSR_06855 [Limisphaerales bacterium]
MSLYTGFGKRCHNNFTFTAKKFPVNQENQKLNLWRRAIGLLCGLLPLFVIVASIVYGLSHSQPRFVAFGWLIAAAIIALINMFYSFVRPFILLRILRVPNKEYKRVSGLPVIGSILVILGTLFSFGSIGTAILFLIIFLIDTGGSMWFLIATWKDSGLWDR